jgi:uncharacterized protein YqhQ
MSLDRKNILKLSTFLRGLIISLESGEVSNKELQRINDFYMSHKNNSELQTQSFNEETDFMKYFTLGFYIYKFLLA